MSNNPPRRKPLIDFRAAARNVQDSLRPEVLVHHLLPGEEMMLEVHIAWYRDILGRLMLDRFGWFLLVTAVCTLFTAVFARLNTYHWSIILLPIAIAVMLLGLAIYERILYQQYRLLKTNARFIISIPQPGAFPFIDTVELKGLPQVLDPNWSKNWVWRTFQFFTGARDIHISLVAYQFVDGSAKVGAALIIPDMMPDDVFELKRIVFPV